jgi:hypothetical protein
MVPPSPLVNRINTMLLTVFFISEVTSLTLAIIFYLKKRNLLIQYFIPFLLTTVIVEFLGSLWNMHKIVFPKNAMYNVFTAFEFVFYAFLFSRHFKSRSLKTMTLWFIPFFLVAAALNIVLIQGFNKTFNTNILLLGSFFIVIFCCCFFYESVLPDQIDQQLSKQPFFWVCSGLLIYYLGSVIINALFTYLTSNDLLMEGIRIYNIINNSLNVVLYSSFCIAFLLCPNNKKKYSSQLS